MAISQEIIEQWLTFLIANAVDDVLTMDLSDDLGGNVIHINSSIPRHLNLSIANTLKAQVEIVGQPGPPTPDIYHFHIQFVNNQCFFGASSITLPDDGPWQSNIQLNGDGYVTDIYLLSTEKIVLESSASPGNTTSIQMTYSDATLSDVTKPVLQVGVSVGQNVFALLDPNKEPVTGTETVHLATYADATAVTPLVATLVQPKTILNDKATRSLLLRLVNTSPEPVTFEPPNVPGSPTPTAVQLSVDIHDTAAWALCTKTEATSISVNPPTNWTGDPAGSIGTGQKTWLFRPDYSQTTQIAPNSSLEFPIKDVMTTLPPGFTNLYVTFVEFPNYGTQTAVTQIEKSPLIYNTDAASGLLSQGTRGANQGLTLNGNTTNDLLQVNQIGTGNSAHFKGGAGVNIENGISLSGKINDVTIDKGVITSAGFTSNGESKVNSKLTVDTLTTNGLTTTGTLLSNGEATVKAKLTANSLNSLGTTDTAGLTSTAEVNVKAALKVTKGATVTEQADVGSLIVQGTTTAKALLTANNGATLSGQLTAHGPVSMFGNAQARQPGVTYGAATDGIVWAYMVGVDPNSGFALTIIDGNLNGQWVAKAVGGTAMATDKSFIRLAGSFSFPVAKGSSYAVAVWNDSRNRANSEVRVYFMPIGTSQTAAEHGVLSTDVLEIHNDTPRPTKKFEHAANHLVHVVEKIFDKKFDEEQKKELEKAIMHLM